MQKSEEHRNKWALGLTVAFSVFIFVSFGFYKGYLNFGNPDSMVAQSATKNIANVISADLAPSPIENSKRLFGDTFGEIIEQYNSLKDSLSAVFVPFITGIEIYDRK